MFAALDLRWYKLKKKWFLIPLFIVVFIIFALWGGDKYLYSLSYNQLHDIAVEKTACEGTECDEQIANVIKILQDKEQLSQDQIMRCLGANIIAERDFKGLDPLKNQVVEWIYQTCESDAVNLEDANIELYEGPSSHSQ